MKCTTFKEFNQHLSANTFVYLIDSKESFTQKQALLALKKKLQITPKTLDCKEASLQSIFLELNSFSLIDTSSSLILENVDQLKESKELINYLKNPRKDFYLILLFQTKPKESFYQKGSLLFSEEREKPWEIIDKRAKWIVESVKSRKKEISLELAKWMVQALGEDMQVLNSELEKILLYCLDQKTISKEAVFQLCTVKPEENSWRLVDQLSLKNLSQALLVAHDLKELKTHPLMITKPIRFHFHTLLHILSMHINKTPFQTIKKEYSQFSDKKVEKMLSLALHWQEAPLKRILINIDQTEREIKQGLQEPEILLEKLIISICSKL